MRVLLLALILICSSANAKPSPRIFQMAETLDFIWQEGARLYRGLEDPRTRALMKITKEVEESPLEILDPESRALIHDRVLRLFKIFPSKGASQTALITLCDRLDLWQSSDFSILVDLASHQKSRFSVKTSFPLVLQYLDEASIEQKNALVGGMITIMVHRDLANLLLLYKLRELPIHKFKLLLQYLAEESISGEFQATADDTSIFAKFPPAAAAIRQTIYRQNVFGMLQFATSDLHARFKNGDPVVIGALEEVKRRQAYKDNPLSPEDQRKVLRFISEIENGTCRWYLN